MTLAAWSSDPEVAAIGASRSGLAVQRAFLSASVVSLVSCHRSGSETILGADGFELLERPKLRMAAADAASRWCGLRIDIDPVSRNRAVGVPQGASIHVESVDPAQTPFVLSSDASLALIFETEDISNLDRQPLLVSFDLSVWLDGLPLVQVVPTLAARLFESQLRQSASLYSDANGNGHVDPVDALLASANASAQ